MSKEALKQFKVRLPVELKRFVEAESQRNRSSMGSEVVRAVRERMEKAQRKSGPEEMRPSLSPSNGHVLGAE